MQLSGVTSSTDALTKAKAASLKSNRNRLEMDKASYDLINANVKKAREAAKNEKGVISNVESKTASLAMQKLNELAADFESLFVNMLMKKMRGSEQGNSLFGNSPGHRMFSEMRDENYSKELAKQQIFGIGEMITENFKAHLASYEINRKPEAGGKEK